MNDYSCLSFDCYGTLIDWESGIVDALQPLVTQLSPSHPFKHDSAALLGRFTAHECRIQAASPRSLYSTILAAIYHALAHEFGLIATEEQAQRFAASIAHWPAFPDTMSALHILKQHFKIVILSNVDRVSFAASLTGSLEGFIFDAVYTAEEIGSYKPDLLNFQYLIEKCQADLGIPKERILHTAYALIHDLTPARKAGLAGCWIERKPNVLGGDYEELKDVVQPRFHFATLGEMANTIDRDRLKR